MSKKLLISSLAVLTIFSISSFSTYASTGYYGFQWKQCTNTYIQGTFEIQANVGSPNIIISWSVPLYSYEYTVFGCSKVPISAVDMSTYVNLGWPYQPITTTRASTLNQGSLSLIVQVKNCVEIGRIVQCSPPQNYPLKYGNSVVVGFYAIYGNVVSHGLTETLSVTS